MCFMWLLGSDQWPWQPSNVPCGCQAVGHPLLRLCTHLPQPTAPPRPAAPAEPAAPRPPLFPSGPPGTHRADGSGRAFGCRRVFQHARALGAPSGVK
jgi:hypothetical protein